MNAISAINSIHGLQPTTAARNASNSAKPLVDLAHMGQVDTAKLDEKQVFQSAVAGTLFKQMLKSLRQMHGKAAYFHGGQAEDAFQNQMDQEVAENLAQTHGAAFTDALYAASVRNRIHAATTPE